MKLATVDDENTKPVFSCPSCNSENIDTNPPPECNDCGANGNDQSNVLSWIQCPDCSTRNIVVHGVPQYDKGNFRVECTKCPYESKLMWMGHSSQSN